MMLEGGSAGRCWPQSDPGRDALIESTDPDHRCCSFFRADPLDKFLPVPTAMSLNRTRNQLRLTAMSLRDAATFMTMSVIGWWLFTCNKDLQACLATPRMSEVLIVQTVIGLLAFTWSMVFSCLRLRAEEEHVRCYARAFQASLSSPVGMEEGKSTDIQSSALALQVAKYLEDRQRHQCCCDLGHRLSIFTVNMLQYTAANYLIKATCVMVYDTVNKDRDNPLGAAWLVWACVIPFSLLMGGLRPSMTRFHAVVMRLARRQIKLYGGWLHSLSVQNCLSCLATISAYFRCLITMNSWQQSFYEGVFLFFGGASLCSVQSNPAAFRCCRRIKISAFRPREIGGFYLP